MVNGKTVYQDEIKIKSTSDLNRKEMAEFIEKCIRWLAEHGIVVLDPSQYLLSKYR